MGTITKSATGHGCITFLLLRPLQKGIITKGGGNSYASKMMNLATLAPYIVEAILEDELPVHLTMFDLAVDPPVLWEEQRMLITVYFEDTDSK